MARKTLDLANLLTLDNIGREIAQSWVTWDTDRRRQLENWVELQQYVHQTDTTQTTNRKNPWHNSTTIPKLCQIRDNLFANLKKVLFPKREWMDWLPSNAEELQAETAEVIKDYMTWVSEQGPFKTEFDKFLYDYIDYGNIFAKPEWVDETQILPDGVTKVGYVGPKLTRISPVDIVMNPLAASARDSTFIVRSWMTIGEFAKKVNHLQGEELEAATEAFEYMKNIRRGATGNGYTNFSLGGDFKNIQEVFAIAGFDNFLTYLQSNFVEVLTFYGDIYDMENDELLENYEITVVDRHKVIAKKPSESLMGYPPIVHTGWRKRQDSLWAMGPLENLVGLQYRLDHLENMKADALDLTVIPPLKIRGYVEDFEYAPGARIGVGDDGDVDLLSPDSSAIQVNIEIQNIMNLMEEMAGAPKEALGFRTPGEKTAFEVDKLFTAGNRLFNSRADSLEEEFVETGLNLLLELARRKAGQTLIRVFDDQNKIHRFTQLDKTSISGTGRIKPIGARHFSEQSEILQNMMQFAQSPMAQDPMVLVHFSGERTARLLEDLLNVGDFKLFSPYVRVAEQAELQQQTMVAEEQVQMRAQTPAGISPNDFDEDALNEDQDDPDAEDSADEAPEGDANPLVPAPPG
jgi:hypothetical protein